MKLIRYATVACAVLLLATAALAQGGGGRGGQRGMRGGGADFGAILNRSDVATELKLTDDQKTRIRDTAQRINEERRNMFQGGGGGGDFQAMQEEMRKKQPVWDKAFLDILNPEQQKRAKQLLIQRAGPNALQREDVQKELGLSADQIQKLRDLQARQREMMADLRDMSPEERQAAMQKNQKAMEDEVAKILNDGQKAKLKELSGAPFKFEQGGGGG